MKSVVVGPFDDIRSWHIRFLQEAARLGRLHVLLWDDALFRSVTGRDPKYPQDERLYYVQAIRYVGDVDFLEGPTDIDSLPEVSAVRPDLWIMHEQDDNPRKQQFCTRNGLEYRVLTQNDLAGFPNPTAEAPASQPSRKKVIVTGCFDWFHSGHVRFLEEASQFGDLYVVVGHDANIRALKGQGHPMLPQEERRYVIGSVRHVAQALISSGDGWLDAEPEIQQIRPDIYLVNEDGDQPIKRQYCREHGIEYVVLKRLPKPGLPPRTSTRLRGF